ncbi:PilN domain-containing protein [Pseudomonas sp. ABC1]|uniref:PilN domain-containing protein n=1 Tax=Pseudomonas sp. ABC1 TaxID=2748080 RepID=UPI0015C31405|nr:PilN domain-containing protein [Pseudomonas sp. ABC1]QLF92897.1 PilN domain-containing protein [Pseudomonas sp. ABC1]
MAGINLLPWRERLRQSRRRRFLTLLGVALVCSAVFTLLAGWRLGVALERQDARNDYLRQQLARLGGDIDEVAALEHERGALLEQVQRFHALQASRPVVGRVLEELVRLLPEGVHFSALKMKDGVLSIEGHADSDQAVSGFMQRLGQSRWLASPALSEVRNGMPGDAGPAASQFRLGVRSVAGGPLAEGGAP